MTLQIGKQAIENNFVHENFNNITTQLTIDTNDYFVSSIECRNFVIENCLGTTRFFMITSACLLILLGLLMYKEGYFDKSIEKVRLRLKKK